MKKTLIVFIPTSQMTDARADLRSRIRGGSGCVSTISNNGWVA